MVLGTPVKGLPKVGYNLQVENENLFSDGGGQQGGYLSLFFFLSAKYPSLNNYHNVILST